MQPVDVCLATVHGIRLFYPLPPAFTREKLSRQAGLFFEVNPVTALDEIKELSFSFPFAFPSPVGAPKQNGIPPRFRPVRKVANRRFALRQLR